MLKKTIRRLGALAMVLAMAVSVFAVNASAANSPEQVTITKTLTKAAKAPVPATSFEFTITPGTVADGTTVDGVPVVAGPAAITDITYANPTVNTDGTQVTYVATVTLPTDYTAPGIYNYTVKETKGSYDGMMYDENVHSMNVYVNKNNEVYGVTVDGIAYGKGDSKKDLTFNNTYTTYKLTVDKVVAGLMGVQSDEFEFTVRITGAENEKYTVVKADGQSETIETAEVALEDGSKIYVATTTVTLTGGKKFEVYGLSKSDKFEIVEDDYASVGYKTTNTKVQNSLSTGTVTMGESDQEVTYTNTKEPTSPTGVIMTIAPYALMVVLAGAFAVVFLTRRNRAE